MTRTTLGVFAALFYSAYAGSPQSYPLPPEYPKMFEAFRRHIPADGLISDDGTARAIGKVVLEATFGKKSIDEAGPLEAHSDRDFWVIQSHTSDVPKVGSDGYMAVISKYDGRVLYLTRAR